MSSSSSSSNSGKVYVASMNFGENWDERPFRDILKQKRMDLKVELTNNDGTKMDCAILSKEFYVPEYYDNFIKSKQFQAWKKLLEQGTSIVVYDFDGPRKSDSSPDFQELTLDLLKEKIGLTKYPIGHGYILASALVGYNPDEYLEQDDNIAFEQVEFTIDNAFHELMQSNFVASRQNYLINRIMEMKTSDAIKVLQQKDKLKFHQQFFFPRVEDIFIRSKDKDFCTYLVEKHVFEDNKIIDQHIQEIKNIISLKWKTDLCVQILKNIEDQDDEDQDNYQKGH